MENWSLDNHPILVEFRKRMDSLAVLGKTRYYNLFLSPPYAMPTVKKTSMDYLYYNTDLNSRILTCAGDVSYQIELGDNVVRSASPAFKKPFEIKISMNTFCTSVSGLSFNIMELENDIYDCSRPIHPFYLKILECYDDSDLACTFLEKTFVGVPRVTKLVTGIEAAIFKMTITPENREEFVQKMSVSIDQLAAAIFECPETQVLPVGGKFKLNYLIFNAISSKAHFKLFMAYTDAYATENSNAQKNMHHHITATKADMNKMQEAAGFLRSILHLRSPAAQIKQVTHFFDAVVASLPGVDVAADDILPAICAAMTLDIGFASHVVSFFTYLAEIWPSQGLDERTNYILITCSIAASHLAVPPPQPKKEEKPQISAQQTQETIDALEDLLNLL